jgi:flagellar basal-body rod protein FlgG
VNRAMMAAASGMAAQQQNMDIIASNLANADVPGFKGLQATFESIGPGVPLGTAQTGVRATFEQGKLMKSGGPFDCAIDGAGFFVVEKGGERGYTRAGAFSRAPDGSLRSSDGWTLVGVRLPSDGQNVRVSPDGAVLLDRPPRIAQTVGHIRLVTFPAPEALRSIGSAVFAATHESGMEHRVSLGRDGQTKIAFGMLEKSNVSIVEAMMQILAAQRAYEANAKGVQAADEMLRIANNLNRG